MYLKQTEVIERGDAPSDFDQYAASWWEEFQAEKSKASAFWNKVRKRRKMKHYARM